MTHERVDMRDEGLNENAWWYVSCSGGGESTPAPNRLGDYTGRHFEEGVAF